jgi:AraC-like DNA-binding protein
VLRPEEFAKHVRLERADCAPGLSAWVENYWSLRWQLPEGASYLSSTLPHPACSLTVERGHRREDAVPEAVVVTGVIAHRFDVTLRDSGWVFGVKFRPGGLASLTGVDARQLRDRTVAASEIFDAATVDRLDELGPDHSSEDCRLGADDALGRLATTPEDDYRQLLEVVATMLEDRSLVRVAQVEERCAIGARALQRLFRRYVGVSPKWVLSRYRIHDALTDLDAGYAGTLADLAARYGWFDQAHFTREFTDLVGVPPSSYQRA